MRVISYIKTVPAKNSKPQKEILLHDFIQGVNAVGDNGDVYYGNDVLNCDVHVIQGWVYEQTYSPHLKLRKSIIESPGHTVTADANLFLYHNKENPWGYLRYSFNGIFPTTGNYCDSKVDGMRWEKIKRTTGIVLEPYKMNGSHIVLLAQRRGGWSMKGYDVIEWLDRTIQTLQQYTDRPIIIRGHPGDKRAKEYLSKDCHLLRYKNVKISPPTQPLEIDLLNAWAVINHNSSAAVGPAIKGHNVFLTDPKDSQCREIANTDLTQIEQPKQFNREAWAKRISMSHWNFEELKSGEAWSWMRQFI
jgi:hypothetical protein